MLVSKSAITGTFLVFLLLPNYTVLLNKRGTCMSVTLKVLSSNVYREFSLQLPDCESDPLFVGHHLIHNPRLRPYDILICGKFSIFYLI